MKHIKKTLALLLAVSMVFGSVGTVYADEPDVPVVGEEIEAAVPEEAEDEISETPAEEGTTEDIVVPEEEVVTEEVIEDVVEDEIVSEAAMAAVTMDTITKTQSVPLDTSKFYTIFHLDCGRNYFSVQQIKNIIDEMAKDGYNTLELAVGNDALRLVLDDMSVTANGKTYDGTTVANALKSGNSSYRNNGTNQLTQSEMDTIIAYANSKNIGIIPLINAPGHANTMLAIMKAVGISNPAYGNDPRTIDVRNAEAVNFSLALVNKYIQYFASKGCKIFNMGADEYANTSYSSGSMGFGHLQSAGEYGYYADYVNNMAAQIQNAGMTAMAFNDGIYFNSQTTASFDSNIAIAYWTPGWGSYVTAPASFLANKGHKIINTNDGWYYVVGRTTQGYGYNSALNAAKNTKVTDIPGNNDPTANGAMMCLWYDESATYDEAKVKTLLSTLAENNKEYFVVAPTEPDVYEMEDTTGSIKINTETEEVNLTSVTMTPVTVSSIENDYVAYDVQINGGEYTGAATVTIALSDALKNAEKLTGFVVNADSTITYVAGTKSADGNTFSFVAPHFSTVGVMAEPQAEVDEPADQTINLNVGETNTITIKDANYAGTYTPSPAGIATVTVTGQDKVEEKIIYNKVSSNPSFQSIINNNGTVGTNYYLKVSEDSYYQAYVSRSGTIGNRTYSVGYYKNGSDTLTTVESAKYSALSSNSIKTDLYTYSKTDGTPASTTIKFEGVSAGTTYVTIGGTTYKVIVSKKTQDVTVTVGGTASYADTKASTAKSDNTTIATGKASGNNLVITGVAEGTTTIVTDTCIYNVTVQDKAPTGAMTATSFNLEYWITNVHVTTTSGGSTYTKSISTSTSGATSAEGIDITTQAPNQGYWGSNPVYYWQAMRLDSNNKQTTSAQADKTTVGTAFTHVRYRNGAWQYKTTDGAWHYFMSGDQVVAYYLQKTETTKEVTTYMKDWGWRLDNQDSEQHVMLSVGVVYPDGTLSPSESDIYSQSSTIFNYWSGRDIGIVAPVSNSDYEISKITYTRGTRAGSTTSNKWSSTGSVNWNKTTTAAGTTWYDETVVWDDTMGTTPMVNGKVSNITWPATNTGILVLIYLKPVHHDSNLTVKWVDDSANTTITTQEVVVDYTGSTAPTFLTDIVNNGKKGAPAGTIDLKDDAYIVNKAGVHQTFNKDLTVMQNIPGQYTSGLYQYKSADISEDGKTLTLHYTMDSSKLTNNYVVDFGLGVDVPLSDFGITNTSNISKVTTTSNASYANGTITFTPASVMTGIQTVTARIEFKAGNPQTLNIGFVPATSVYYEEDFINFTGFTGASKSSAKQAKQKLGESTDEYGYDAAYAANGSVSKTNATSNVSGDKGSFTFTGTGFDLYADCTKESGTVFVTVKDSSGAVKKAATINTASINGNQDYTTYPSGNLLNVPIFSLMDLAHDTYTVSITHMLNGNTVAIDGFRVYNTIADSTKFKEDLEDNPNFIEVRNLELGTISLPADSKYASDVYKQIYSQITDAQSCNAVLTSRYTDLTDYIDNGPKNEIYLHKGMSLTLNIGTSREVQIGLRGLQAAMSCTINGSAQSVSTTDMFYTISRKDSTGSVTIANNSDGILAVTKLKVCDDPSVIGTVTEDGVMDALYALGYAPDVVMTDANLKINLKDYSGKVLASTALTANGAEGETATFAAADIEAAAQAVLPSGYSFAKEIADASVVYGQNGSVDVQIGKVATLKITYKKGSKVVGTATLTRVQTSKTSKTTFTTSEIKGAAPAGYSVISLAGTSVNFGSSKSINATCL